jgi:hypothetical protein
MAADIELDRSPIRLSGEQIGLGRQTGEVINDCSPLLLLFMPMKKVFFTWALSATAFRSSINTGYRIAHLALAANRRPKQIRLPTSA